LNSAREDILGRIRSRRGNGYGERVLDYTNVPREYKQSGTTDYEQTLGLFEDRLQDYGCSVFRCALDEIAQCAGSILTERGKRQLVIPVGLPEEWLPPGFEFVREVGLTNHRIDCADGVMTACAAAIAMTGTIILGHSGAEGSRALTLIPDYHLCVVFDWQVVELVPEGIARMNVLRSGRLTTISGPSATSDIEMTRIKGVHGPRTMDIILVQT
jgi:L-lactate dehydrogenase complex protein LldG